MSQTTPKTDLSPEKLDKVKTALENAGDKAYQIGRVTEKQDCYISLV